MKTLQADLQTQAHDLVSIAAGYAQPDRRVFVQNTDSAAVHFARARDDGFTACGWRYSTARSASSSPAYRFVNCLNGIPGHLLCKACLPTERAIALSLGEAVPLDHELSGDDD